MANVHDLVATATGYKNTNVSQIPLTNITGTISGELNPDFYVSYTAPDLTAVGAGGGAVFVGPGLNQSLTAANALALVNLTAMSMTVPADAYCSSWRWKRCETDLVKVEWQCVARLRVGGNVVLGVLVGLAILLCV
jgi:hypothetical protein